MKKIVAFVFSIPDGSPVHSAGEAAAESGPPGGESLIRVLHPGGSEPMRLEVVLSDAQAEQFLTALLHGQSPRIIDSMVEELLKREMQSAGPQAGNLIERIVQDVERRLISQVYSACNRVKTKTAARLGIDRNTLHKKLRQYKLVRDDEPE
jgi:DNA-binding protein Fis